MAITKNTKGSVTVTGNTIGDISNVTITIDQDMADVTPIGKTWKETLALGKGWSVTGTVWNSSGDTGLANFRTRIMPRKVTLSIGTKVPYGKFWEKGFTRGKTKVQARPFLKPAIAAKKNRIMQEIADGMMGAYKKA